MDIQRVGVIGGGQLAWMMALEAPGLGIELAVQTPNATDPAVALAVQTVLAPIEDAIATAKLAQFCDAIAFENEFVDLEALSSLEQQGVCFRPPLSALAPLLDKYHQRCYLRDAGLPVPAFQTLEPGAEIPDVAFPIVMKARKYGYDGQGTAILTDRASLEATWRKWGNSPVLLEEFVPFDRELAVVVARSVSGEIALYPIVETQQEQQVCRRVIAPADLAPSEIEQCEAIARTLMEKLGAIGVFGIELFLTPDGKIWVNEIAPRTHNSGHFSLDACETSQFAQHLRAVSDRPLGSTALVSAGAVMVNLLGYESTQSDYLEKRDRLAQIPSAVVRWYGKSQSRPGRKLGHVTVRLDVPMAQLRDRALAVAGEIESIWYF